MLTFNTRRLVSYRIIRNLMFDYQTLIYIEYKREQGRAIEVTWKTNERTAHSFRMQMLQQQLKSIENHYRHIIGIDISKIALSANLVTNKINDMRMSYHLLHLAFIWEFI